MCSVCLCFCSGFDCITVLKFCLYCVLSCCVCIYVCMYVLLCKLALFLCMWLYVYCSGAEEWRLPSTGVETINQSINQ